MTKLFFILALVALPSCSVFTPANVETARDAVRTIDDLGRRGCQIFYSDQFGISWEDALKYYCTDENVQKFRDVFLSASQSVGASIGAPPPDEIEK